MSGRFWALVLLLAVVSAAVGAGAALLLRETDDLPAVQGAAVEVVTPSAEVEDQESVTVASTPESTSTTEQADDQTTEQQSQVVAEDVSAASAEASSPASSVEEQAESAAETQAVESDQAVEPEAAPDAAPRFVASAVPDRLTQGESFALNVTTDDPSNVSAVAVTSGGRSWGLTEVDSGEWWGIVAVPRDWDTGFTEIVIDLYAENGAWLDSITTSLLVLANTAPLEEIILGGTGVAADQEAIQRDHDVRFVEHIAVSGPPQWQGAWIVPVVGEVSGVFGSHRTYDGVPGDSWHHGHDIAADHGDPIVAPAAGVVVWAGELVVHGIGVIIDHGAGVYSGYWHMSQLAVREGMEVAAGDWLGNIGSTGLSTGPHLHWEVIVQGIDVDPVQWLGSEQPPIPATQSLPSESAENDGSAEVGR